MPTASRRLGNTGAGIITYYSTQIGGTTAAARNVIASNGGSGIIIRAGTGMAIVQGNYIGTDASGMLTRGNAKYGVDIESVPSNTIGGADAGDGNLIDANGTSNVVDGNGLVPGGVLVSGASGSLIERNVIGLAADGVTALGNFGSGILVGFGATGNTIRANTIAFNATSTGGRGAGVAITAAGNGSVGNAIDANSIFSNTGLGIDLGDDGVTMNSAGSPHSGPNNLQSFPVLTSVSTTASDTVVVGTLTSAANTAFTVQFFANDVADPTGYGQGKAFLGELTDLTTNGDGFASFTVQLQTVISPGQFVTATATDPGGNTSEFSQDVQLPMVSPLVVTTSADSGPGSLRAAITYANANPGLDAITFDIAGSGVQTISPLSPLPTITDPVLIDGYTQPGSSANTNGPGLGDNANIRIALDGTNTGRFADGLTISSGGVTARGMAIGDFNGNAIELDAPGGDTIAGNFLGSDAAGTTVSDNFNSDVFINGSPANTIGGTTPAARNLLNGLILNGPGDVYILGGGATGNLVEGNFIGVDATGASRPQGTGTGDFGIRIQNASGNTIGGTTAGSRNIIANSFLALYISASGSAPSSPAADNRVEGNYFGTDVTGTKVQANSQGIVLEAGASQNTIGGANSGAGNVISGTTSQAVRLRGIGTTGNLVEGNFIGTDAAGSAALGNGYGVEIDEGASGNTIGGTASGAGNILAFSAPSPSAQSGGSGIDILAGTNDAILGNSIYSNARIGIGLGGDSVTTNSAGGPHSGPNDLQNYPVIAAATTAGENMRVQGTLNSTPLATFRIELFTNPAADPSGFGQGQTYLGFATVTTDASGNAGFDVTFPTPAGAGPFITATATDPNGNTSEFSRDLRETTLNPLVVTTTLDSGPGSLSARRSPTPTRTRGSTRSRSPSPDPAFTPSCHSRRSPRAPARWSLTVTRSREPRRIPNAQGAVTDAVLLIELNGANAGTSGNGLEIAGGNSTVRGLVINGFSADSAAGGSGIASPPSART